MKKLQKCLAVLCSFAMLTAAMPYSGTESMIRELTASAAQAYTVENETFYYYVQDAPQQYEPSYAIGAVICGYDGKGGFVTIPEEIDGHPVVGLQYQFNYDTESSSAPDYDSGNDYDPGYPPEYEMRDKTWESHRMNNVIYAMSIPASVQSIDEDILYNMLEIQGYAGSAAMSAAKQRGISFVDLTDPVQYFGYEIQYSPNEYSYYDGPYFSRESIYITSFDSYAFYQSGQKTITVPALIDGKPVTRISADAIRSMRDSDIESITFENINIHIESPSNSSQSSSGGYYGDNYYSQYSPVLTICGYRRSTAQVFAAQQQYQFIPLTEPESDCIFDLYNDHAVVRDIRTCDETFTIPEMYKGLPVTGVNANVEYADLKHLVVPDSVTEFSLSSNTSITIYGSAGSAAEQWVNQYSGYTFMTTDDLTKYRFSYSRDWYPDENYDESCDENYEGPRGYDCIRISGFYGDIDEDTLTIPETIDGLPVKIINGLDLRYHENIKKVVIPESVTEIRDGGYDYYSGTTIPAIPQNVEIVGTFGSYAETYAREHGNTFWDHRISDNARFSYYVYTEPNSGNGYYNYSEYDGEGIYYGNGSTQKEYVRAISRDWANHSLTVPDSMYGLPVNFVDIHGYGTNESVSIESVTIPASVTEIYIGNVERIFGFRDSAAQAYAREHDIAFTALDEETAEELPKGMRYALYHDHAEIIGWDRNSYEDPVRIPELIQGRPVTVIRDNAFEYCCILIPDTVTQIGTLNNVSITGERGSMAETYALEHDLYFYPLSESEQTQYPTYDQYHLRYDHFQNEYEGEYASANLYFSGKYVEDVNVRSVYEGILVTRLVIDLPDNAAPIPCLTIPRSVEMIECNPYYYSDSNNGSYSRNPKDYISRIRGYVGSEAQAFARRYEIPFTAIETYEGETAYYMVSRNDYQKYTLTRCNPGVVSATIPESINGTSLTIEPSLFDGCNALESVTFLSRDMDIPENLCSDCNSLREIIGYSSSEAEYFARKHGYTFTALDDMYYPSDYFYDNNNSPTYDAYNNPVYNYGIYESYVEVSEGTTRIGSDYAGNKILQTIFIPESVTEIYDEAFQDCSNLQTIIGYPGSAAEQFAISHGISFIAKSTEPRYVFLEGNYIADLWDHDYPNSSYYNYDDPAYGKPMQHYTNIIGCDPEAVTYTIPETINGVPVGSVKLENCEKLKEITLPEGLKVLESLQGCSALTSIQLPETLVGIGNSAFRNTGITELTLPAGYGNENPEAGSEYYSAPVSSTILDGSQIHTLTIPNPNAKFYESDSRYYCELRALYQSTARTYAEEHDLDFYALEDPNDPAPEYLSYERIGNAFRITGCDVSVEEAVIPKTILGIPVTQMRYDSIENCTELRSLTILPKQLQITNEYGETTHYGYYNNEYTYTLSLPDKLEEIHGELDSTALEIAMNANLQFYDLDGNAYGAPEGMTLWCEQNEDGGMTLTRCRTELSEITLPSELYHKPVTRIVDFWNLDAPNLTAVTVPESVATFQMSPFTQYSDAMKFVFLNDTVDISGSSEGFENIEFWGNPDSAAMRYADEHRIPFYDLDGNPANVYSMYPEFDFEFYDDHAEIIRWNGTATTVEIPAEVRGVPVTRIADSAFADTALTSITLPDTITSIGWRTFAGSALRSITLPDSLTEIGSHAFNNCDSLTGITIPENVTNIEYGALSDCDALISVSILNRSLNIDVGLYCCPVQTIYGYLNSPAMEYAERNHILFVPIDLEARDGLYYVISDNDAIVTKTDAEPAEIMIPALIDGHPVTEILSDAFADCDTQSIIIERVDSTPVTIKPHGNDITAQLVYNGSGELIRFMRNDQEISKTADGRYVLTMASDESETVLIAVSGQKQNAVAPTCTEDGTIEYYEGSDGMRYVFTDGQFVPFGDSPSVERTGHNPGDAVVENLVEATYEAEGSYDEVVYCKDCGAELSRTHLPIAKLEHTYTRVEAVPATCEAEGSIAYYLNNEDGTYCLYDADTQEYTPISPEDIRIPAKGHTPADAVTENETDTGYDVVVYCTECGAELSREHIERIDISDAYLTVNPIAYAYDGSEHTVYGTLTLGDTELVEGRDYILTGNTATKKGTYTATAQGIGQYTGTVYATWKISTTYYVTVNTNGKTVRTSYEERTSATVRAPDVSEMKFSHWEDNGKKVSTSQTYSFTVLKNVNLNAVYVDEDVEVVAEPILNIETSRTVVDNENAVKFTFTHSIPSSSKVKEVGILYASNKMAGADTSNPAYAAAVDLTGTDFDVVTAVKENTSGKVKKMVANYVKQNGTAIFSGTVGGNTECYVYAVGYAKVINAEGQETVLYTDFIATTFVKAE